MLQQNPEPGGRFIQTGFCPLSPRLLEYLLYQRVGRKPMAYSNMVTEMSLISIKLFIKARARLEETYKG